MRLFSIALMTTLIATSDPVSAQAFRAENRVVVTGKADGLFTIPSGNRYGARGAWCAAADYAIEVLGAKGTSRLYVRTARSATSGPVTFGLTPGDTTPVAVTSTGTALQVPGSNLSVDHAFQFCHDARLVSRG